MNESELSAAINILSGQLNRVLSTKETTLNSKLDWKKQKQSWSYRRRREVRWTMAWISSQQQVSSQPIDVRQKTGYQCIRLSATLDIWHYKKCVNKREPEKTKRVCEIVSAGSIIEVGREEAELLVAENRAVVI